MNRQVPTLGKLLVMAFFALSVFGLTLFLWLQFGGNTPFKAQPYTVKTSFPEATQLATQADVRIAGVAVGRVLTVVPGTNGRAQVTFGVQRRFAPLPKGTKAILRQKTLLGETYISLTPPLVARTGTIEEGGTIPIRDVGSTVELDELFATFDPATRRNFQVWMQQGGAGVVGQGGNIGASIIQSQGLVRNLKNVTETLDEQSVLLASGLRDNRKVFAAASATPGALTAAITQANRVFKQTAEQDAALTATVDRLPAFLTNTAVATKSIENFARETGPAATALLPTARALAPATKALANTAPELDQLLTGVERVNKNAVKGLPAAETTLKVLPTLLDPLDPFLKQLNPIVEYAGIYTDQLMGAVGNFMAATNGVGPNLDPNPQNGYRDDFGVRSARAGVVLAPDALTANSSRFSTNQANAYRQPDWASFIGKATAGVNGQLANAYSQESCGKTVPRVPAATSGPLTALATGTASSQAALPNVSLGDALAYSLFSPLGYFSDTDPAGTTPNQSPAPTTPTSAPADCLIQNKFNLTAGSLTTYPQLPAAPTSTQRSVTGN